MKRLFLFAAIIAAFLSCSKKDEPQQKQSITFKVSAFEQSTEPMSSPRRAPQATILDDEGGTALTDLYVFDGAVQVAHQVYADDNDAFGTGFAQASYDHHH